MRALAGTTLLILAFSLACAGEEQPKLKLAGCEASSPVATATATLQAHIQATPAWAPGFTGGTALFQGETELTLPSIKSIPGWMTTLGAMPVTDGGPLLCEVTYGAGEGRRFASVSLPGGPLISASDPLFAADRFTFSLPGAFLQSGATVPVAATRIKTTCKPSPFWVLVTGLPFPECVDRKSGAFEKRLAWNGAISHQNGATSFQCRAMPLSTAAEQTRRALDSFESLFKTLCTRTSVDLTQPEKGWDKYSEDAAHSYLWEAASFTGWADPAVRSANQRLDTAKAAHKALVGG